MESCTKHPHERGAALCGRCGTPWCNTCLVYALGPKKPPLCMPCAMYAGGVRTGAVRPALPRREMKALQKAAKAAAKTGGRRDDEREAEPADAAAATAVEPAPATADWETPWWEDRQPSFAD